MGSILVPNAPQSGMTLLATTSMASTLTSVSNISGSYNNLMMVVENCFLNNFDPAVVKINSTTGNIRAQRIYNAAITDATALTTGANLTTSSGIANMVLIIYNYASTTSTKPFELIINALNAGTGPNIWLGNIVSTSAVTSVDFTTNGGTATWSGGTIKTYGVK